MAEYLKVDGERIQIPNDIRGDKQKREEWAKGLRAKYKQTFKPVEEKVDEEE